MNKEKYLPLNIEDLYKHLISDVLNHPSGGKELVVELSKTERFQEDFEFRAFVNTTEALVLYLNAEYSQVVPLSTNLITTTTALELWNLVSINYNLLGCAYFVVDIFERSLECFQRVIKNELDHNLNETTPLAYYNIGLIYSKLDCYDKALNYCQLALDALEKSGTGHPRYREKKITFLSNLISLLCQTDNADDIPSIFEQMEALDDENIRLNTHYSYLIAKMHYCFHTHDYNNGKEAYCKSKEMIPGNDVLRQSDAIYSFISLCIKYQLELDFYVSDLLEVESLPSTDRILTTFKIFTELKNYYQKIGDTEHLKEVMQKHIELLEKNSEDIRVKQLHSLELVEHLIQDKGVIREISFKNRELELIAEEAIRHKNMLEEAYHRIEMINELGQKMTSSLKLSDVIELIYVNLKNHLPLDTFLLMAAEPEENQLRSLAFYEYNQLKPDVCLSLDHPESIFVECYKKNELIVCDDFYTDPRFMNREFLKNKKKMHSAVFLPLNVGNQLVGICSVQCFKPSAYTEKDILFLKQILPYLSISLNNAVRSRKLEQEIRSHLKTQVQLEKANHRLELLSSLDGLTQISSRRDFETRVIELIRQSQEENTTLTLFMLDIDNFKLYNDTYGHLEGDEALKKVAQTIRRNLDSVNGLSARFGGEEFIGACVGLNATKSKQLANQIRQDIFDQNIPHIGSPLQRLTVSIGITVAHSPDVSLKSDLLRLTDISLYKAKNSGKNKVVLSKLSL